MVENDIWKTNWSPKVQDVHLKSNNMFLKTSSLMNYTNSDNIRTNIRWKKFSDCRMRLMISKFMQYQRLSNWIFPCIVHVADTTFLIYGMQTLSFSWSCCHFAHVYAPKRFECTKRTTHKRAAIESICRGMVTIILYIWHHSHVGCVAC